MIDLDALATNLEQRADGIWYTRGSTTIDYPPAGNAFCFQLEEDSFWFKHRNAAILAAVRRFPPGGTFFDVGGGNGFVTNAIQQAGFEAILLEPGIEGIRNAQQRGLRHLVCAALQDAGFMSHSLPAAGLFDVLEHIADEHSFLRDLANLLVPGGRLYLTVPAYNWLWSSEDDFAQHYRRYQLSQLIKILSQSGFQTELASYIFTPLPAPILLLRALPSKLGFRKDGDTSWTQAELKPGSKIANSLLEWMLSWELKALQTGQTLPFGGSCLVVCRVRE